MIKSAVFKVIVGAVLLLFPGANAMAQFSADSPVGISAGLAKLFGSFTGFSAKADVQVLDTNRQELVRTPMNFALLDGKMRMEIDMVQMKGRAVPPTVVGALKQAGLAQVVSIVRLDKKRMYLIFPGARSYANLELSKSDADAAEKNLQIQKTVLGSETIDTHPCSKNKIIVKNSKGTVLLQAITWNATDLKDFPVQIAVQAKDSTTTLRFNPIQTVRPGATLFEPPADYARFSSPEALVVSATQKNSAPPKARAAGPKSAATKR